MFGRTSMAGATRSTLARRSAAQADVEFPAPHREARRAGEGMRVVVQLLATDPEPRREIGGGIAS